MGHKKLGLAVTLGVITILLLYFWFSVVYAPRKLEQYTNDYGQGLNICPYYNVGLTRWVLHQGFLRYQDMKQLSAAQAYSLSVAYSLGIGTPIDQKLALTWLRQSALQNNPRALVNYALVLGHVTEGEKLLIQAAQAGNSSAQFFVAMMGSEQTVNQNLALLAADGSGAAQYMLGSSLDRFNLILQAALNPNTPTNLRVNAIFNLVNDYELGHRVMGNPEAAKYWQMKMNQILLNQCDPFIQND